MISKEWLEYYQKKFNGKNGDCISYRPDGFEIIKKNLEEKEKQDEILKHLDFSDGAIMTGFDYNEKQIVAMPLSEYDRLMKIEEQKDKQDRILNALLKNADYQYDECYGVRGHQCIMIGITEKDECFEEIREMVENYKKNK